MSLFVERRHVHNSICVTQHRGNCIAIAVAAVVSRDLYDTIRCRLTIL